MSASLVRWPAQASAKPAGQVTRGFTAANRLRKADAYLAIAHEHLIRHGQGMVVDLGFGRVPVTTLEMAGRLRALNPSLRVLGIEIERDRVAAAQEFARDGLEFRFGGFNMPLLPGEQAIVVRAMNVLRQYDEHEVTDALSALATGVVPGGLLLEGTSNPTGRLLTLNVFRRLPGAAFDLEEVVFATRPSLGFSPRQFQAVLPKTLIHHAEPGGPVDSFFERWEHAWMAAAGGGSHRRRFQLAAERLAQEYTLAPVRNLAARGMLVLRPPWPALRHNH